ncbi:gigaxonin [Callorhinchus milii]|uniref:Gigaxonin n=1 Tax=Callorhinchus milii TaxID=7868 RepID=A0A4W3IW63_CALMI|nr:gigaxonin [Callorhinchus milii]XP_007887459.1 gigaxonin [Callorhinchus milii]XP_007887460.1 gigaxonin [Callorhinchus milii]|eukprot:gi/632944345/ref/XP_007887458.1/ PREDICTED: gigaxonin [Callorhinchus milii]
MTAEPGGPGSGSVSMVGDPQHANKLLLSLRSFRLDPLYCDAVLVVGGEEIPVQKNLLAAVSPYVRTKLNYTPPTDDGSVYKIVLDGISFAVMQELLDYMFTGQIKLSEDTIQDIVQAADLLLLTDLKALCCEFLEGCIAPENCIGIRDFALHYSLQHVHYVATEYLETHFRDVSHTDEFTELSHEKVKEIIALEKLNVGNERYIFEAVVKWICYDEAVRKVHMKDVMSVVWVNGLEPSYLRERMLNEPLVREIVKECSNIPLSQREGEAQLATFKPRGYSECIVTVGGEERSSRKPTAVMRCMCPLYDRNRQLWIDLAPMSVARINHGLVAAEGFLFVLGGQDSEKVSLSSGEKYDSDTNCWSPIPTMNTARHNFGIVAIDGVLYVLGGEDGEKELLSMEAYDIHTKTWTKQPNMTMIRKIGCYAAMKKKIFAMGGGSYGKLFESVESYDPKTQQWTAICPLKEKRFGAVACGVGLELYVFGGVRSRDGDTVESSEMVTCKSEFYHDQFKRWIYLNDQSLCIPTSSSFVYGAVHIGASIYVIGDLDTGTQYDFVREFRRSTGTWHHTKPLLPSDLRRTGCAALRIANCKLFRLQLQQGLFRIRVPSAGSNA